MTGSEPDTAFGSVFVGILGTVGTMGFTLPPVGSGFFGGKSTPGCLIFSSLFTFGSLTEGFISGMDSFSVTGVEAVASAIGEGGTGSSGCSSTAGNN